VPEGAAKPARLAPMRSGGRKPAVEMALMRMGLVLWRRLEAVRGDAFAIGTVRGFLRVAARAERLSADLTPIGKKKGRPGRP
jgi:hypothetical protein